METPVVQATSCSSTVDNAEIRTDVSSQDASTYNKEAQSEVEKCVFNMLGGEDNAQNIVYVKLEEAASSLVNKNCELQVANTEVGSQNVIFVNLQDVCPDSVLALMEGGSREGEQALVVDGSTSQVPSQGGQTIMIENSCGVNEQALVVEGDLASVLPSSVDASNIISTYLQPGGVGKSGIASHVVDSLRDKETEAAIQNMIFSNGVSQSSGQVAEGSVGPWVVQQTDLVGDQVAYTAYKKTLKGSKRKKEKKGHSVLLSNTHSDQKKYVCEMCNKSFSKRPKFVKHMERLHRSSAVTSSGFQCSICNNSFANKSTYSRHWDSHFNEINTKKKTNLKRSHICGKCGKAFLKRTHLREHEMCAHLGFRRNWCSLCVKGFTRPSKLKRHMMTVHNISDCNPEYGQAVNAYSGSSGQVTLQHMGTGDAKPPAVSTDNLPSHSGHHKHKCEFCDRSFPRPGRLKKHVDKHHRVKTENNSGTIASHSFANKALADDVAHPRHSASRFKESRTPERSHICGTCGKGFLKKSYLSEHHLSAHSGERRHWCEACQRGFTRPSKLQRHLDTVHHTSENSTPGAGELRPIKIMASSGGREDSVCYSQPVILNVRPAVGTFEVSGNAQVTVVEHSATRVGGDKGTGNVRKSEGKETPYSCPVCIKTFSSKKKYRRHCASHDGRTKAGKVCKRPLVCSQCGKNFTKKKHLKKHVAIHTSQSKQKNMCYICQKGFSRPVRLRKHMASLHNLQPI